MALNDQQQQQVDELRKIVGDMTFDDAEAYEYVSAAGGNLDAAAAAVWRRRSNEAAQLVDVSEGSSRRTLSQLAPAALRMAAFYQARADEAAGVGSAGRSTWRPVVR